MLSQVIIQRIRLYFEACAVFGGHLSLFSFTGHVFIYVFVLHGPMPSMANLLSEQNTGASGASAGLLDALLRSLGDSCLL